MRPKQRRSHPQPALVDKGRRTSAGSPLTRRAGGFLRSLLVPGVAALVAGAALVFQAPQLVDAVARGCVTPGVDGPNATLTGVVNTYYPATASAAAGTNTISVGARIAGGSPTIAIGDLLLVIQMQDADINATNSIAYGDGATGQGSTALRSTGLYEYVSAASALGGGPGVVTIVGSGAGNGLVNSYDFSAATVAHGVQTFQVIRVPQYSSATVSAGLTAAPWDGALHAGGVLAIDVAGALNLNTQIINVDQLGFKGGLGVTQGGGVGGTGTDYVVKSGVGYHGYKGEGVAGTPRYLYDAINKTQVLPVPGVDGYPNGDAARGAPGTAGGGGTDSRPGANDENSGGGGGANGGQGGMGGKGWNAPLTSSGGLGGAAYAAAVTQVVLGGGGGAGTRNNSSAFMSSGGSGGGIVMIRTGSLAGTGTITANGWVGVTPENDGGGGGGAGGSVVVTTNTGNVNGLTIHADGGKGTDAWPTSAGGGGANYHGPGGGGGGGVIITSNALPPAQTSVLGGAHGTTTLDLATYGSVSGSAGLVQATTPAAIPGSSSGAECLPVLTATKTTSTPNVTNSVAGTTATYSITVSNAVNTAAATSVSISDALPPGFTYASTGSVVLNGGATQPATVNPALGDINPAFGTFTIPASGSVVITFTVNVAATVAPGTYSNPATATYLDPTRTTVAGTTSAGYVGGGVERVTVHAPDMTIAKSHVDPLVRGSTSTYTLTATNSGNVATSGTVTVTDTLPAGLTPTGAAGAGWTCPAPVGQTVTCTRADALAAGSSYPPITVTVSVLQSAPNSVTNQASVSGGGETITTNDTASDPTNIVSLAEIGLTKTVSNATPNQNTPVTFTVTATNNGPSNATGVHVSDLLPAGLNFVSSAQSVGTYDQVTGDWNIGALANGSSATLQIIATVTLTTPVINTATKTAETETDPVAGNNSASATVTGVSADISVLKTVNQSTPTVGQNVTYTIVANNLGPSTATGVQLSDLLPAGVTFVSYTATQGAYNSTTGIWFVGTMVNGSSVTLSVVVRVTAMGTIVNTVTVVPGNYFDPNLSNNVSSATMDPLPGLPNTSAPDATGGGLRPAAPQRIAGLLLTILTGVAGLGMFCLAGIGRRRNRARFGQRRSRSRQRQSPGRLAIGLAAVPLSFALASLSAGELASYPSAAPSSSVASLAPGTQLIGSKVVAIAPPVAPAAPTTEGFHPVAGPITPSRLRIPSIGVDAWIGAVGLRSDGSMDVPNNLWSSSWLATGPRPGQAGNAVIAGHRGVGSPALFSHLENVQPGDRIYVSDAAGNEVVYVVTRVASLDLSTSTQVAVFGPSTAPQLVLITCFGQYMNSARTYDHRLVVFGQPLPLAS